MLNRMTKEEFDAFHERSRKSAEESYKRRGKTHPSLGEKKENIPTLQDMYKQNRVELDTQMATRQEQIKSDDYSLEKRWPVEKLPPTNPRVREHLLNQINHGVPSELDRLKQIETDYNQLVESIGKLQS